MFSSLTGRPGVLPNSSPRNVTLSAFSRRLRIHLGENILFYLGCLEQRVTNCVKLVARMLILEVVFIIDVIVYVLQALSRLKIKAI